MKNYFIYILVSLFCLTACQNTEDIPLGKAKLCLNVEKVGSPIVSTRAVSSSLAVTIKNSEGGIVKQYAPGAVIEEKIELEVGTYTIIAYSDNQDSWQTANEGKGAACYYKEQAVTLEEDKITYVDMQVPLTNYAVTLSLPALFDTLFTSYTFTLTSGLRTCEIKNDDIKNDDKVYFDVEDGGFTYTLKATNREGKESTTAAVTYNNVECGKLYTLTYSYGSDPGSGGIDVGITDNTYGTLQVDITCDEFEDAASQVEHVIDAATGEIEEPNNE